MVFWGQKNRVRLKEMEDVYCVSILFSKKVSLPKDEEIVQQLKTAFSEVRSENGEKNKENYRIFGIVDYAKDVDDIKKVPAHVAMERRLYPFTVAEREKEEIHIQPDCEEAEHILKKAKYELCISDFLSIPITPKQRGYLMTSWVKIMTFLCKDCLGIYNHVSQKIMTRSQVIALFSKSDAQSFLELGVKLRLFPIGTKDEILIDTLGFYGINFVDLQYHLKRIDPTNFLEHAKGVAKILYDDEIELAQGEEIVGISSQDVWTCHYERSIALPKRRVIDIEAGIYAAK